MSEESKVAWRGNSDRIGLHNFKGPSDRCGSRIGKTLTKPPWKEEEESDCLPVSRTSFHVSFLPLTILDAVAVTSIP